MDSSNIKQILEDALPQTEVAVEGGDGKYFVTVVGDHFEGLNRVKREMSVYQILNEHIVSGAIHAVNMRLLTPAEQESS